MIRFATPILAVSLGTVSLLYGCVNGPNNEAKSQKETSAQDFGKLIEQHPTAAGPVYRTKFTHNQGYVLVEVLDDTTAHFEYGTGAGPAAGTSIYTSPMVYKTNYEGPTSVSHNGNVIDTPKMQLSVNNGCIALTDKVKNAYLTTVCPADLGLAWKGINIDNAQMQNVYGLGQYFKNLGSSDGDWVSLGRFNPSGQFGNTFAGFNGGANSQVQFPIMYAAGANSKNFALFLDNVYKQDWNFQVSWWQSRMYGDKVRFYLMSGENLPDLRKQYMELTGKPPVPPKKAFGLWVSEFGFDNWGEIDGKLAGLRAGKFPVDGFVLDLQWFGGAWQNSPDSPMGGLNWDLNNFPNPDAKIQSYKNDHIGLITIEESYVAKNQWSFNQMNASNRLVHYCNSNSPLMFNQSWMGQVGMVDWADTAGADWWHDTLRWNNIIRKGIVGHWTDLGEPELYDGNGCYASVEPGKFNHSDIHNLYNFLWHKSIYEGYWRKRAENQQRPFLMARAGTAGLQRFGASMWSGDIASRLDVLSTHMNAQMHMAFAGIDFYGADVGGFWRKEVVNDTAKTNGWAPSEGEMYTQWFANAAWLDVPVRVHTYNCGFSWLPTYGCPYKVSPHELGNVTSNLNNIRRRYELTPYYYSLAHRAYLNAEPVIVPPVMYYQNDVNVHDMGHQKLIGRDLMVGIVARHGESARGMYLPAGQWINFYSNQWTNSSGQWVNNLPVFQNNTTLLPVFARAGAIIPMMHVDDKTKDVYGNRTDGTRRDELIVKVYADNTASSFTVYDDDGTTVASYDDNKRPTYQTQTTLLTQQQTEGGVNVSIGAVSGSFAGALTQRNNEIRLVVNGKTVNQVMLNGSALTQRANTSDFYANADGWVDAGNNQILARSGVQDVNVAKDFQFVYAVGSSNQSPTANAGADQSIVLGANVSQVGSGADADGTVIAYQWKEGNTVLGNTASLSLSGLSVGAHTLTLTVTDNLGATGSDTAVVTVTSGSTNIRRTVIFMYGQTVVGQDMFMRGGIDWTYAKNNLGRDCGATPDAKWLCAIPITHNLFASDANRANDKHLDWYGAETGQTAGTEGSPLVWTTNNAANAKKVAVDGYGYTPLNKWGDHYWMLDVQMDCSKGVQVGNDIWVELKSYISNGPAWESNVTQAGAPYVSGNHFAKCGWVNMFKRGDNSAYFEALP